MKRHTTVLLFLLTASQAFAADAGLTPPIHPDYLSDTVVPLNPKELKALELSGQWAKTNIPPVMVGGGKIIYVHGAVLPSIIASPMQVSDIELQPGEMVKEIVIGDSARWMVDSGTSGSGATETVHVFVKPVDSGIESSAIITTDRRTYHLRLISRKKGHTPYVGFRYLDELKNQFKAQKAQEERREQWQATEVEGERASLEDLNFNYEVKGKASWKPSRVYDDGRQTYIQLAKASRNGEIPVLLVRKGGNDIVVNYRVKEGAMIVDGLFDHISLVLGVGGSQEKVEIRREK